MSKLTFGLGLITIIITSTFVIVPDIISRTSSVDATIDPNAKSYTLADISTHTDKESCWTAIEGKVYDLTSYVSNHPGGERAIMKICGKDGTSLFENKHGGSSGPEKTLEKFLVGNLTK